MSIFTFASQITAFDVSGPYQAPTRKYMDWGTQLRIEDAQNPQTAEISLAPTETAVIFNGSRTLTVDGTTEITLSLVAGTTDRYRFVWSDGTAPGFRTDRSLSVNGSTIAVTINANSSATFSSNNADFASLIPGDIFWIPGVKDGVTSPFHRMNQGFWTVLTATSNTVVVKRENTFSAYAESGISVTSDDQVEGFSAAGVQIGDKLQISLGFAVGTRKIYSIIGVTSSYLEIVSSLPLALEDDIVPTAAGISVFTALKRWVRVESDQEISVAVNGDTSAKQVLVPWLAGDGKYVAEYVRTGPTHTLSVVSRALVPANVTVLSVE